MSTHGGTLKKSSVFISVSRDFRRAVTNDRALAFSTYWGSPSTLLGVFFQSAMMLLRTAAKHQHYRADIVIIPKISHLRPDEIGKMDEFIKAGEEAALEKIDEIKKLIFSEEEILTTDLHRWTQIL